MLLRFAVQNFMSFKEPTEFSMVAGKMTRHQSHIMTCNGKRILKGSYIFGANAGGKSNLIRAIAFARDIVSNGLENTNCDKKYFRIEKDFKSQPSVFQFDIFFEGHFYSYGYAVSLLSKVIEEEWLYQIDDQEKCIFLRSKLDDAETYIVSSDLHFTNATEEMRFSIYTNDISKEQMKSKLFLTDIVERVSDTEQEYKPFHAVANWFEQLTIIFPSSHFGGIIKLLENEDERTKLETLLSYFDTGINQVHRKTQVFDKAFPMLPDDMIESLKTDLSKHLKENTNRARFTSENSRMEVSLNQGELVATTLLSDHGNADDLFEYSDESDGTQRLFDLIPVFNNAQLGRVILIDELDRSLHTKAVQEFIKYFYYIAAKATAQLIVTTHDSNLLDLDLVRQDEIWFVERQKDHSSKLYSLSQFKARFDKKVEKDYLLGRYGAIPIFRQMEFVESSSQEEGDSSDRSCQ